MSKYENLTETQQFACRVIADHARATAFSIADGILPGNEGRNYVLRKIMRRAIYHGREHLGLKDLFFYKVCDFVVDQMHEAYPELETQREVIRRVVILEEERFNNTVTTGLARLNATLPAVEKAITPFLENIRNFQSDLRKSIEPFSVNLSDFGKQFAERISQSLGPLQEGISRIQESTSSFVVANPEFWNTVRESVISLKEYVNSEEFKHYQIHLERIVEVLDKATAESESTIEAILPELVKLYDTYGTPRDLIRLALQEEGFELSEDDFNSRFDAALQVLQQQSGIGKTERNSVISPIYMDLLNRVGPTRFFGYDTTRYEDARIKSVFRGDVELLALNEGEEGNVVLDATPFYAESGGQVGDTGILSTQDGAVLQVLDTYSPFQGLIIHKVRLEKGEIRSNDSGTFDQIVTAAVDVEKRDATRRNHTATHLVHAALKEVLGSHVKQAGSVVAPGYLRFDFTHYQPMTGAEVAEVEDLVNHYILQNEPVTTNLMALEDAMRSGAVAMFGEKYGGEVRVLSVGAGTFSKELCGGTHVRATGDIGSFKITSDEAIASGVRRIRAITGFDAFKRFREDELLIDASLGALKTQRDNLPNAIERLQEELKRTRREMEDLKLKIATGSIGNGGGDGGDEAREIKGVNVIGKVVEGLDANGTRQLSDTLLARLKSGVVILGRKDDGKVGIIVRVSDDLTGKVRAGDVIREIAPIVGGKGGGKAEMAEGGGSDPTKLSEAIDAAYAMIERKLS